MKNIENKTKISAISLVLILTMTALLVALTSAETVIYDGVEYTNVQPSGSLRLPPGVTPDEEYDVIPRLNVAPNPVQVDQSVIINGWLSVPMSPAHYHTDYKFVITKPDGTSETYLRDSFRADGTSWLNIVPDQIGTWNVQYIFQGSYWPPGNYTYPEAQGGYPVSFPNSLYFKPTNTSMDFVVQSEPVPGWPDFPLPTDYWTRPVGPDHRNWWPILGWYPSDGISVRDETRPYWPGESNDYARSQYGFIPFTQAPLSPHVVHIRDNMIGGMIGGDLTTYSYGYIDRQFSQHVRPHGPEIIYGGIAYEMVPTEIRDPPRDSRVASEFPDSPYGTPEYVFEAYDIRTGEILFQRYDVPFGKAPTMVTYWEGYPEIEGAQPLYSRYVWLTYVGGGRLINYHPWTGTPVHNISIAPLSSGVLYTHKKDLTMEGSGRVPYFFSVQNLGSSVPSSERYRLIEWTVTGTPYRRSALHDFKLRVVSNITWPWSNLGTTQDFETMMAFRNRAISNVNTAGIPPPGLPSAGAPDDNIVQAASMITGEQVWSVPTGIRHVPWAGPIHVADQGKVAFRYTDGYWHVFDQETGDEVWTSELTSAPWGAFPDYGVGSYDGLLIVGQTDGVAAWNWGTGEIAWHFEAIHPYPAETGYGSGTPFFGGSPLIADGVIYYANAIHTVAPPLPRGWKLYAINATTGEQIWSIAGTRTHQQGSTFIDPLAIGDGYLTFPNGHDGRTYIIGKGKSKTTVSAPQSGVYVGESITITGSVLDQSPAQPDTPAVADEDQGSWMEYLHMNYPRPEDAEGVLVTISVLDSNDNFYEIGTATTDLNGNFGLSWEIPIPGKYQVFARFEGSNSYGSSEATTYFTANEAPSTGGPIEPEPSPSPGESPSPSPTTSPSPSAGPGAPFPTEIAIIAVVAVAAVIGIGSYWFFRKRG